MRYAYRLPYYLVGTINLHVIPCCSGSLLSIGILFLLESGQLKVEEILSNTVLLRPNFRFVH